MRNQPKIISGIDYQGTKDQVSAALKVLGQGVAMESALENMLSLYWFLDKNVDRWAFLPPSALLRKREVHETNMWNLYIYNITSKWSQVCKG